VNRWVKVGGVIAVAVLAAIAAFELPLVDWASQLVDWMRNAGPTGAIVFAVVYVLAAVLMVPGSVLTAGAGLAYGPWWGIVLVSPVSVLAATVAFLLGRTAARGWIAKRTDADPRFRAVDAAIGRHGLKIVTLLRLSPVFPFNVLNYALGLTGVRLRDYVLGSFIGMLPGTFLYIYIGSLVGDLAALTHGDATASAARQALSLIGLAATVIVTVYVTRVARQALADELSRSNPVAPAPQV
jgi:uncharacterized membrane protein YdjX (TVP38/TMEM64 family)